MFNKNQIERPSLENETFQGSNLENNSFLSIQCRQRELFSDENELSNSKNSNIPIVSSCTPFELENPLVYESAGELPTFPLEIYENLPIILKKLTAVQENQHHRDIALLSGIVFLSSLFPKVKANYGGDTHHANLFGMVVAPSSMGKSNVRISEYMTEPLNEILQKEYRAKIKNYQKNKDEKTTPIHIKEKTVIISANSSDSALIDCLANNDGIGIIYTNEMDNQPNQDWANLSPIFRQMFDHQTISKLRVQSNTIIRNPKCSILYTGTPNQFKNIIPDIQSGLFQRFLIYSFGGKMEWKSPLDVNYSIKDIGIKIGKEELLPLLENYKEKDITFKLDDAFHDSFNNYFSEMLNDIGSISKKMDLSSLITRGGNIVHRIAMVLTITRNNDPNKTIKCERDDFITAIKIFDTCIRHSVFMATVRREEACPDNLKPLFQYFKTNEKELTYKDILKENPGYAKSSLSLHIKELIKLGLIKKTKHGAYMRL